ncbi:hypothetical protein T484DRAFT_1879383 [Baffinella frigidus]|nr:hypothetical protein T484DRAFT_1879383 [Cryptophyta sp. CCMP2293]
MANAAAPLMDQPQGTQQGGATERRHPTQRFRGRGGRGGGTGRGAPADSNAVPVAAPSDMKVDAAVFQPGGEYQPMAGIQQAKAAGGAKSGGGAGKGKGHGGEGGVKDVPVGRRDNQAAGGSAPSEASQSAGSAPADQPKNKGNKSGSVHANGSKVGGDDGPQQAPAVKKKGKNTPKAVASADAPPLKGAGGDPVKPAEGKAVGAHQKKGAAGGGGNKGRQKGGAMGGGDGGLAGNCQEQKDAARGHSVVPDRYQHQGWQHAMPQGGSGFQPHNNGNHQGGGQHGQHGQYGEQRSMHGGPSSLHGSQYAPQSPFDQQGQFMPQPQHQMSQHQMHAQNMPAAFQGMGGMGGGNGLMQQGGGGGGWQHQHNSLPPGEFFPQMPGFMQQGGNFLPSQPPQMMQGAHHMTPEMMQNFLMSNRHMMIHAQRINANGGMPHQTFGNMGMHSAAESGALDWESRGGLGEGGGLGGGGLQAMGDSGGAGGGFQGENARYGGDASGHELMQGGDSLPHGRDGDGAAMGEMGGGGGRLHGSPLRGESPAPSPQGSWESGGYGVHQHGAQQAMRPSPPHGQALAPVGMEHARGGGEAWQYGEQAGRGGAGGANYQAFEGHGQTFGGQQQPLQQLPRQGQQSPSQNFPAQGQQSPSQNFQQSPSPNFQAQGQQSPAHNFPVSGQQSPLDTYQAPGQQSPAQTYQAPRQPSPAQSYQASGHQSPAQTFQAPEQVHASPVQTYQAPRQPSPAQTYQEQRQPSPFEAHVPPSPVLSPFHEQGPPAHVHDHLPLPTPATPFYAPSLQQEGDAAAGAAAAAWRGR